MPGTQPLLKPEIFSGSPQTQKLTLSSQKSQILSSHRDSAHTYGKKTTTKSYTKGRIKPKFTIKCREVMKQNKTYSPP